MTLRLLPAAAVLAAVIPLSAQPALTIYNQDFAVVREQVPLKLNAGENTVTFADVTVQLEPDSVVLRDPSGRVDLQVLEQNYRADTISQGLLLSLNEGKTLDFLVRDQNGKESVVRGRVVRSGYVGTVNPQLRPGPQSNTPIIEVDGQLRFSLPGEPVFPALGDDTILKPQLTWTIATEQAAQLNAELSYVTGGLTWDAAYNLISPEKGDNIDLTGWVTISNQSGKSFENSAIKLMAGDVNKIQPAMVQSFQIADAMQLRAAAAPAVSEKAFDEFHLYTIARPTTLHDRETKQVQFVQADGIPSQTYYIYDGADLSQYRGWNAEAIRGNRDYGTQSTTKVQVMREFVNSEANGLGVALPAGRIRFYRRDDADGSLQFTGENTIDHTPKDETLRIYTGDSFDLVGERTRTDYTLYNSNRTMEEAFEIRLRNHKDSAVEIRVDEHLYRWVNWEIIQKSHDFTKTDAQNIEFRVNVPANGETVVTYRVRYNWQ